MSLLINNNLFIDNMTMINILAFFGLLLLACTVNWKKLIWFLDDRCSDCGGNLYPEINNHYYCVDCGKKNG